MSQDKLNLCKEMVKTLPKKVQEYLANRFRRSSMEYRSSDSDSAMEIYRYAFFGEKPPRRYRSIIQPILVAIKLVGDDLGCDNPRCRTNTHRVNDSYCRKCYILLDSARAEDHDFDAEWNQNRHL